MGDRSDLNVEKKKSAKTASAKIKSTSETGSEKTGSVGKSGSAGGRSNASEFGWYGNMTRGLLQ